MDCVFTDTPIVSALNKQPMIASHEQHNGSAGYITVHVRIRPPRHTELSSG